MSMDPRVMAASPYMTREDILRELHTSRSAMKRWMLTNGFPRPLGRVKGNTKAWDRAAVYRWVDEHATIRLVVKKGER